MNERYEKWLDEQLKQTVDSGKVEFDSEQWKRKYPAEYQVLVCRSEKRPDVFRFLWGRRLVRLAAVIAVASLVIFIVSRRADKRIEQAVITIPEQSPAVMLSRLSLMLAYNRGGMEAIDEQCRKASRLLGQKDSKVSIYELLNDNGNEPERKEL